MEDSKIFDRQWLFKAMSKSSSKAENMGLIALLETGFPVYSPIALLYIDVLKRTIEHQMNGIGFLSCHVPLIQPDEMWKRSGRYHTYLEKYTVGEDKILTATAEEYFTLLIKNRSYGILPFLYMQTDWKFRKEMRPKGLNRTCEFLMHDAYSFNVDAESLHVTFVKVHNVYRELFSKFELPVKVIRSDDTAMGGNFNLEFVLPHKSGDGYFLDDPSVVRGIATDGRTATGNENSGRCIELAHIFDLEDYYSNVFDLKFNDKKVISGSYGIGVSRLFENLLRFHGHLRWDILDVKAILIISSNRFEESLIYHGGKKIGLTIWWIKISNHVNRNFSFFEKFFSNLPYVIVRSDGRISYFNSNGESVFDNAESLLRILLNE